MHETFATELHKKLQFLKIDMRWRPASCWGDAVCDVSWSHTVKIKGEMARRAEQAMEMGYWDKSDSEASRRRLPRSRSQTTRGGPRRSTLSVGARGGSSGYLTRGQCRGMVRWSGARWLSAAEGTGEVARKAPFEALCCAESGAAGVPDPSPRSRVVRPALAPASSRKPGRNSDDVLERDVNKVRMGH
jgi:hypothetical protein